MGMHPNSVQWTAPKYVKQSDQRAYNAKHNWRGMSFWTLDNRRFHWIEYNYKFPRNPIIWNVGTEVFDSVSGQNATILGVHGTNDRDDTFVFIIKLNDGTIVHRVSTKLDIAF